MNSSGAEPDRSATAADGVQVLGIEVSSELLKTWRHWWAPALQPFPVDDLDPDMELRRPPRDVSPSAEVRDTFFLYAGDWGWWYEEEFLARPISARRRLNASRRRRMAPKPSPPWPSGIDPQDDSSLIGWVETGAARSRHEEVPDEVWGGADGVLPRGRALAGTFPADGSGANCFATVIAARDPSADEARWVTTEEFAQWLAAATSPVAGTAFDDAPGTVLVWREHGTLAHAAVTLGGGWALVKPSQAWSSPRLVQPVRELILSWRFPGTRLERHRLSDQLGDALWHRGTEEIDLEVPERSFGAGRETGL